MRFAKTSFGKSYFVPRVSSVRLRADMIKVLLCAANKIMIEGFFTLKCVLLYRP